MPIAAMPGERPPYVRFELGTAEDRNASIEQGRYIARDVERVIIMAAGSKDTVEHDAIPWLAGIEERARKYPPEYNPEWAAYFRAAYNAWKEGQEAPVNGTSIRAWALLSPAQVQNLTSCRVLTIEDLAAANEEVLRQIGMGGRDLKNKAIAHLEQATGSGVLVSRLAAMEAKLADLEQANRDKDEVITKLTNELDQGKVAKIDRRSAAERLAAKQTGTG